MSFRLSRINLEDETISPKRAESELLARIDSLASTGSDFFHTRTVKSGDLVSVSTGPVCIASVEDSKRVLSTIVDADPFTLTPTDLRKPRLSIETEESFFFSSREFANISLVATDAIYVHAIEVEAPTMQESPHREPPFETVAESICIDAETRAHAVMNTYTGEKLQYFPAQRKCEIQSFQSTMVESPVEEVPNLEDADFLLTLSDIMSHPKCPAYIKRIVFSRLPSRFLVPNIDVSPASRTESVDELFEVATIARRSLSDKDMRSPAIVKSQLVSEEPPSPTLMARVSVRAVSAISKLQRRVRNRYQGQREELINSLGL